MAQGDETDAGEGMDPRDEEDEPCEGCGRTPSEMEIEKKELLDIIWRARVALLDAANQIRDDSDRLKDGSLKCRAAGNLFWEYGEKFLKEKRPQEGERAHQYAVRFKAENNNLRKQNTRILEAASAARETGIKIFDEAVLKICGPIKIEWFDGGCRLESGEEFLDPRPIERVKRLIKILPCDYESAYQDDKYGKGLRLKEFCNKLSLWSCTVCRTRKPK